ncbi:MAG: ATP-binding protein [Pseudomonadota bacterium]
MASDRTPLHTIFRKKYVLGLACLAVLIGASQAVNYVQASRQNGRAALTKLASGQTALSQRIAFFANKIADADNSNDRAVLQSELRDAVDRMREAHDILTQSARGADSGSGSVSGVDQSAFMREIYFNRDAPFDAEVRTFLDAAERLARTDFEVDGSSVLLDEVNLLGMYTIMQTHEVLSRVIAYRTEQSVERAKAVQMALGVLALFVLVLEGVFIFEPTARFIRSNVQRLEASEERALEDAQKAMAANEAKSNFLRMVSHELRTPLNAVIGMSELLDNQSLSEDQRTYVRHIRKAGDHMVKLTEGVLTINRQDVGKLRLEKEDVDLHAELAAVIDQVLPNAEKKHLTLSVREGAKAQGVFVTDVVRFRQIAMNIIENAVKYTDAGAVRVSTDYIAEDGGGVFKVTVSDTGVGVPEDKRDVIFEEFEQAESQSERTKGGVGLGLAVSRRLANALGGDVRLEQTSRKGSVFSFSLLVERGAAHSSDRSINAASASDGARRRDKESTESKRKTILVVDDNLPNRMIAAAFLKNGGYSVLFAENGQEAIDIIDQNKDISMVFMDIEMPVMDGLAATKLIRARGEGGGDTPVVALTAHALPEDAESLKGSGFNEIVRKPATESVILKCAEQFARRSSAA